jgi:hypothetical protein
MTLLSDSATDRASQLMALSRRLRALVKAEADALRRDSLDAKGPDWDEKERLANAYRHEIARLKKDPSALSGLDDTIKAEMRAEAQRLADAFDAHAIALSAKREVNEGLVRAIAQEVARERSAPTGYGAAKTKTSNPASSGITLNSKA